MAEYPAVSAGTAYQGNATVSKETDLSSLGSNIVRIDNAFLELLNRFECSINRIAGTTLQAVTKASDATPPLPR